MTITLSGGRHVYEGAHPFDLMNPARAYSYGALDPDYMWWYMNFGNILTENNINA